jgi:hypothetical protein
MPRFVEKGASILFTLGTQKHDLLFLCLLISSSRMCGDRAIVITQKIARIVAYMV